MHEFYVDEIDTWKVIQAENETKRLTWIVIDRELFSHFLSCENIS